MFWVDSEACCASWSPLAAGGFEPASPSCNADKSGSFSSLIVVWNLLYVVATCGVVRLGEVNGCTNENMGITEEKSLQGGDLNIAMLSR